LSRDLAVDIQHVALSLAQTPVFDLVIRAKSAECPGVRKTVESMPDEFQVLATFEGPFIVGHGASRACVD
jgi:hypothetical protein